MKWVLSSQKSQKFFQIGVGHGRGHALDELEDVVAALAAQFGGGKLVEGHVGVQSFCILYADEARHVHLRSVGLEACLLSDPVGALAGNGALGEGVAEPNFEFGAVEGALAVQLGYVELALFLVRVFFIECGRSEDELQLVHCLQLLLQSFEGIDGERRSGDRYLGTAMQRGFQVVDDSACNVVELAGQFHSFQRRRSGGVVSYLMLRSFGPFPDG